MLVGPVPETGRTCRLTLIGICHRLLFHHPAAKHRPETGDGEIQQRLQGVSTGMSSFAARRLDLLRRVASTGNHEEAHSFAFRPDDRSRG